MKKVPIVFDDNPGKPVIEAEWGGKNALLKAGKAATPGPLGSVSEATLGAGEATEPERHCVDAVGLRTGCGGPTLDSENGQLMLLRMARVV